jgi:hypothetical protein
MKLAIVGMSAEYEQAQGNRGHESPE